LFFRLWIDAEVHSIYQEHELDWLMERALPAGENAQRDDRTSAIHQVPLPLAIQLEGTVQIASISHLRLKSCWAFRKLMDLK
jgi:hypothetical protein